MMNLEPDQNRGASRGKRVVRRLVVTACLVVLAGIGLLLWARPGRSVEARLRAIDAAHAIPEEENAARAYTELAWDYNGPSLDMFVLPPAKDGWNENARQVEEVRWLCEQENHRGIIQRLKSIFTRVKASRTSREPELLELGQCRVARILLALRRYRNETGAWPPSLHEIEGRVPPEALIEPLSGKPFAYRASGTGVLVYSVGLNGIDEGGEAGAGVRAGDDFVFWPS